MNDKLMALSTILLALSLASERLLTLIKTFFPQLRDEALQTTGLENEKTDQWRKFIVQLISFLISWFTAALVGSQGFFDTLFGKLPFGDGSSIYTWVVALLTMGGSTFWNNILGYTKAVKDVKILDKQEKQVRLKNYIDAPDKSIVFKS